VTSADEHDRWRDDLSAYVLGALEANECADFERHLETCTICAEDQRWMQPVVTLLSESVPRIAAPRELRERVMGEVRSDVENRAAAVAGSSRKSSGLRGLLMRPASGLVAVVLLAAGIGGYLIADGTDERSGGSGEPPVTISQGNVSATLERQGDAGTLQVAGLSELQPREVYQAWVNHDGKIEESSLFATRKDGTATAAIPRELNGADSVLVTIEPRGGSLRPTSGALIEVPLPD